MAGGMTSGGLSTNRGETVSPVRRPGSQERRLTTCVVCRQGAIGGDHDLPRSVQRPSDQPGSQRCRMEQRRHCGGYSGHSSCGGHHCLRDQQNLDQHGNWPEHDDVGAQHNRPRRRGTGRCSRWDRAIGSDGISVTGRESARSFLIVTAGALSWLGLARAARFRLGRSCTESQSSPASGAVRERFLLSREPTRVSARYLYR